MNQGWLSLADQADETEGAIFPLRRPTPRTAVIYTSDLARSLSDELNPLHTCFVLSGFVSSSQVVIRLVAG
ncbi:hypothetical protein BaRGS_00009126, partial [Batillaria attramentaria]